MEGKYLVLSDIHGNISALKAVLSDVNGESFNGIILLGDHIDYGMRSDAVIGMIDELSKTHWNGKILANIWGNHEKILMDEKEAERLSTDRGRVMAQYTAKQMTDASKEYIDKNMTNTGCQEFNMGVYKCLAVHGSRDDSLWKSISSEDLKGDYNDYDFVFSGHSHYSHCFTHFYEAEAPELRNKKVTCFINPGSVGQPRNQNPYAQYAVLNLPSKQVELRAVKYDVKYEQSLFPDEIDAFYKERLTRGV